MKLAFVWLWAKLKAFGAWLVDHPVALAGALGAALGAFLVYRSNKNRVRTLEDALEVEAARRRIAGNEAKTKVLLESADAKGAEVVQLKREIADSKRRAVEIEAGESTKGKSDDEIAAMFTKAGF